LSAMRVECPMETRIEDYRSLVMTLTEMVENLCLKLETMNLLIEESNERLSLLEKRIKKESDDEAVENKRTGRR
jgi:hypothetical protein